VRWLLFDSIEDNYTREIKLGVLACLGFKEFEKALLKKVFSFAGKARYD
tara:strand:- start:50 stop:196 length:147 start_codon:yes stop_codon:yes gene_type:complete